MTDRVSSTSHFKPTYLLVRWGTLQRSGLSRRPVSETRLIQSPLHPTPSSKPPGSEVWWIHHYGQGTRPTGRHTGCGMNRSGVQQSTSTGDFWGGLDLFGCWGWCRPWSTQEKKKMEGGVGSLVVFSLSLGRPPYLSRYANLGDHVYRKAGGESGGEGEWRDPFRSPTPLPRE